MDSRRTGDRPDLSADALTIMHTTFRAARRAERVRRGAHGAIDEVSDRVLPLIDRAARRGHGLVERTAIGASDAAEAILRGSSNFAIVRKAAIGHSRARV